jgi:PadR family transcriptional regulator, regulatory protein PadR
MPSFRGRARPRHRLIFRRNSGVVEDRDPIRRIADRALGRRWKTDYVIRRADAGAASPGVRSRAVIYSVTPHMVTSALERELKRGSTEVLILSLIEHRQRHGYEIGQLIAQRSQGAISFHIASLYPTLYRLESKGCIEGRWVEKAGQRRRRYYRLTTEGRKLLAAQRRTWRAFLAALNRVAGIATP